MRLFETIVLAALCASAAACTTSWEPQYGPAPQVAAAQTGRTIRVLTRDHGTIEMRNVQVEGDSIIGDTGDPPQRVAVATADVRVITTPKTDRSTANTALVVGGVVLVAITALSLLWFKDIEDTLGGN